MDHAKRGASALAASDTATAVEAYTKALIEHPTSPDYFTQRAIAFSRLKPPRHDLALQDADYGVLCGQKRGKRDKIQAAQQRRVVSLYNLGRYADAKFVLDSMKRWRPKESKPQEMEHNMWSTKIENKLKVQSQETTVKEYPTEPLPDEKAIKKLLQSQLKNDGTYNFEGEPTDTDMIEATTTEPSVPSQTNDTTSTAAAARAPPQKIRHEWYQNAQSVIVTLYAKGVKKDSAEVELEDDSISVSFPHPSDPSSTFTFTLDPLFALIDPSRSKYAVMSTKVELTLAKVVAGQKWANIEGSVPLKKDPPATTSDDPAKQAILTALQETSTSSTSPKSTIAQPTPTQQATGPSYPTSSRNGPKNWDKLANDLTAKKPKSKSKTKSTSKGKGDDTNAESEQDSEPEEADYDSNVGGDAVDSFFKKLYKGADDDTRKAMMKSFQESNGTALSTNWSEVSKGPVEEVRGKEE